MKKIFLIGMATAAILASCSNDETVEMVQPKAIGFESFVDKSTKATDATLANLGSIEVYGWRGDTQIFNTQTVTIATNGQGTYTPIQYWEAGYTYAFEAIAPKATEGKIDFKAAKTGGTITFVNDAETDLLYSKADDVTTSEELTTSPNAVSFTLQHLLSRVKFTFENAFPANAVAKISVKDVQITNAYKNGTITPAADNAVWTATNAELKVPFTIDATEIAAGNGKASTACMYLIPYTNPNYTVKFTVTLNQAGATSEYKHEVTITTSMEKGKSYNFTAKLTPENVDPDNEMFEIKFKADVAEWGTDTVVNIPETTEP